MLCTTCQTPVKRMKKSNGEGRVMWGVRCEKCLFSMYAESFYQREKWFIREGKV